MGNENGNGKEWRWTHLGRVTLGCVCEGGKNERQDGQGRRRDGTEPDRTCTVQDGRGARCGRAAGTH